MDFPGQPWFLACAAEDQGRGLLGRGKAGISWVRGGFELDTWEGPETITNFLLPFGGGEN